MKLPEVTIHNLNPHPVVLILEGGRKVEVPPSGLVLRAAQTVEETVSLLVRHREELVVVPLKKITFGKPDHELTELPDWGKANVLYVVSAVTYGAIKRHYPQHADRFVTVTDVQRDAGGNVIGAAALAQEV